jgi:hypothetical protein
MIVLVRMIMRMLMIMVVIDISRVVIEMGHNAQDALGQLTGAHQLGDSGGQ